MAERQSMLNPADIAAAVERIQQEEGRAGNAATPINIEMLPLARAPRDKTGLIRLQPDPTRPRTKRFPLFYWGTICTKCSGTACTCYQANPTHWGEVPDSLID